MENIIQLAGRLRLVARLVLILVATAWFLFALVSGPANNDQDLSATLQNAPNALPFLALIVAIGVSFRWQRFGGLTIVLWGSASVFFFRSWTSPVVLFGLSLPVIFSGATLVACAFARRRQRSQYSSK